MQTMVATTRENRRRWVRRESYSSAPNIYIGHTLAMWPVVPQRWHEHTEEWEKYGIEHRGASLGGGEEDGGTTLAFI